MVLYTTVAILAAVENLFPPIPADTAVAVGAFLSNQGTVSAWGIFGVTWTANVTSAIGVYIAARTFGRDFFRGRLGVRLLKPKSLRRLERLYERYGTWGIFLSRFVPGVRAVVPPFAGIAGLSSVKALIPMAVASGIWYGALTFVAANLLLRLDDTVKLLVGINRVGLIGLVAIVVGVGAWLIWVRRRRSSAGET